MTEIVLKHNNTPVTPGYYICQHVKYNSQPKLVRVDGDMSSRKELYYVSHPSIFPLSHCESTALWSDSLDIQLKTNG